MIKTKNQFVEENRETSDQSIFLSNSSGIFIHFLCYSHSNYLTTRRRYNSETSSLLLYHPCFEAIDEKRQLFHLSHYTRLIVWEGDICTYLKSSSRSINDILCHFNCYSSLIFNLLNKLILEKETKKKKQNKTFCDDERTE